MQLQSFEWWLAPLLATQFCVVWLQIRLARLQISHASTPFPSASLVAYYPLALRLAHGFSGLAGLAYLITMILGKGWQPNLLATLFTAIASQAFLLSLFAYFDQRFYRLSPLFLPYGLLLISLALILDGHGVARDGPNLSLEIWVTLHILGSLVGYGLVALAGLASLAVLIQRRQLKSTSSRPFSLLIDCLPSLVEAHLLQQILIWCAAWLLALSIISGTAIRFYHEGAFWHADHKSLLSIIGFILALTIAFLGRIRGAYGASLSRIALLLFLVLTLAWPGVKLVKDVILATHS